MILPSGDPYHQRDQGRAADRGSAGRTPALSGLCRGPNERCPFSRGGEGFVAFLTGPAAKAAFSAHGVE